MLRVHDRRIHIGENLELIRHAHVVTVRRHAVTDYAVAHLPPLKGLDHAVFLGHLGDPLVRLHRHRFLRGGPPRDDRIAVAAVISGDIAAHRRPCSFQDAAVYYTGERLTTCNPLSSIGFRSAGGTL